MRTMTKMTTIAGLITTTAGLGLALFLGTPGVATAQGPRDNCVGTACITGVTNTATSTIVGFINVGKDTGINVLS